MNRISVMKIIIYVFITLLGIITISQAHAENLYIYVEKLPDYADHASDVLYKSTKFWEEHISGLKFYTVDDPRDADFAIQWVKEFGGEHVGYAFGSEFVEVGLGDSNCIEKWAPYSSDHVANILKHEIGHILGFGHSDNSDDIMYPVALDKEYGLVEQTTITTENYIHFYPFCIYPDVSSISYQVSSDDPTYGFDVYVVPSVESMQNFADGRSFSYYDDQECYATNYIQFGGLCENIPNSAGLLVIMPPKLTNSLTEISIKFQEISSEFKSRTQEISPGLELNNALFSIDSFTLYTDPQQRFTIEYPTDWLIDDEEFGQFVVSFYDDYKWSSSFYILYYTDTGYQYLSDDQVLQDIINLEKQHCAEVNYEEDNFICYGFTLLHNSNDQIIGYTTTREYDPTSSQIYDITTILYFERTGDNVWIILNDIDTFLIGDHIDDIIYTFASFTLTKSGQGSSSTTGQQIIAKPTDQTLRTDIGTLTTDKQNYVLSTTQTFVEISGMVNDSRRGDKVSLTITYPDGTTNSETLTVTKTGAFQSLIILERNSLRGEYEILASVKNQIVGITIFTVDHSKESLPTNSLPTSTPENNLPTLLNSSKESLPTNSPPTPIPENNSPILPNPDKESLPELISKNASIINHKPGTESNISAGQNIICGKGTINENGQCISKSSTGRGGCLIATATYSSELASQVQFLREIRDTTLQSTTSGVSFMMGFNQIYYSFSPAISDLERGNPIFAGIIKLLITPMLSTLSLITLADVNSELEVIILGIIIIILNVILYIVGPALIISKLYAKMKNHNISN